jgi:hypothetical protein
VVGRNLAAACYAHAEPQPQRPARSTALGTARVIQEALRGAAINTNTPGPELTINALGTYRVRLGDTAEAVASAGVAC